MRFGEERTRPARDLLAHVPIASPVCVVDAGCGPGNSTAMLAQRWPDAAILGFDSDKAMLEAANDAGIPARFVFSELATWAPDAPIDVIFSNAALHWADDPPAVARRYFGFLKSGGALALQVPQNFDQPTHLAIRETAADPRWKEKLKNVRVFDPSRIPRAPDYMRALRAEGAVIDAWMTEYYHRLQGEDPVFHWVAASALRPFLAALQGQERETFAEAMKDRYREAYGPELDGSVVLPFRRLFVIALRG
jgi:trans-aconitate 2-methyltransferase